MVDIRKAVLSGSWYPDDPQILTRLVDDFLLDCDPGRRPKGRPLLAVTPHAGYIYSGATAGRLFGLLAETRPSTIFILAPSHRLPLAEIALSGATAFATPLGQVPVATAVVDRLADCAGFVRKDAAHASEHAIEIQLPFLQRTWPEATPAIVPLLVPRLSDQTRRLAAKALAAETGPDTLLLVSSDFTHYGVQYGFVPFQENIPDALEKLDQGAISRIVAGDAEELLAYGERTGITMCGLDAAALALSCGLPPGFAANLVNYTRSGDRDRDYSLSVSYASILISAGQD